MLRRDTTGERARRKRGVKKAEEAALVARDVQLCMRGSKIRQRFYWMCGSLTHSVVSAQVLEGAGLEQSAILSALGSADTCTISCMYGCVAHIVLDMTSQRFNVLLSSITFSDLVDEYDFFSL